MKDNYIYGYVDDMLTIIVALDHLLQRAIQVMPLLCQVYSDRLAKTNQ